MPASLCGYHGKYLRVDLSLREAVERPLCERVLRQFVGGVGLGAWLLLEETSPGRINALAPEAPLIFTFSPLVGSPLTTSAKFAVVAKSPLTNRINDSLSSSHFAIAGKKTGFDAIVVIGTSQTPICLVVEPDGVRFEDASNVAGCSSHKTTEIVKLQLGRQYQVAAIGPAGERGVRFATISHDGRHAGRGGMGAVMGSKNLKALAVFGDHRTDYANPDGLVAYSRNLSKKSFGPATAKYRELGTIDNLLTFNRLGTLPTRNFQSGTFAEAADLSPDAMAAIHKKTRSSCAACTIGCEHVFHRANGDAGVRMEYENLFALGPLCGVSNSATVLEASSLCDELGIDTISAGATVAFAMECAERGLIDETELRFGNSDALLSTLLAIGERRGIGEILSLGTRVAAAVIGQGAEDFAPHVKGLEIPGYEPRALQTMALGFAVNARGADHNRSGGYQVDFSDAVDRMQVEPDDVHHAIRIENEAAVMDSLILCKFLRGVFEDKLSAMAEMLQLVVGWDVAAEELAATGARIVATRKWYNIRQGWTPAEDTLPKRFLSEALPDGASRGAMLSESRLRRLVEAYNLARGWDRDGWISDETLRELELLPVAHALV